jgi:two-component system sensor histidine kinase ChiS
VRTEPDGKGPVRVLTVDDDAASLATLAALLARAGYGFVGARSGEECLRLARESAPDVILLDLEMPGMDGYEVALSLGRSEATSGIPVIMITGAAGPAERARALKAGVVDFLARPVDEALLKAKVSFLSRRKAYNAEMRHQQVELRSELAGKGVQLQAVLERFSRFVPHEFLHALGKPNIVDVNLGDQARHDMAILFSDIRSFTTLSEKMTPEQNFSFLNSYLQRMNPFIWENGGFIDKYIGDAIMALFPAGSGSALSAAIAMLSHMPLYNAQRAGFGYDPIRIGVGVHAGSVMLGIIGHERFMQGTAISNAVNLASRLEDLTKAYGISLIVSSHVLFDLEDPNRYHYRFIDKLKLKGTEEAVSVYEVFDGDPPDIVARKQATREVFERGVYDFFAGHYSDALNRFQSILKPETPDRPVEIYWKRCMRALKLGGLADDGMG